MEVLLTYPQIDTTLQNSFNFSPIEWSIQYGQNTITQLLQQYTQPSQLEFSEPATNASVQE